MRIALATNNRGKLAELKAILERLGAEARGPAELGINSEPEETGATFAENAMIKARAMSWASGMTAIADDSGLCVDALDGGPGIYSARFGAPGAITNGDRNRHLLKVMENVPDRRGKYVCVIAVSMPDGREFTAEGEISGEILREPRGDGGFGYDPLFFVPEYNVTMAEMSPELKNEISHRAKALKAMSGMLSEVLEII